MKKHKRILRSILGVALSASMLLSGCSLININHTDSSDSGSESAVETTYEKTSGDTSETERRSADGISPMLWKVTGSKGNTVYLFGTIHLGDERNDKVLDMLKGKLDECDELAVEFDAVKFEDDAKNNPSSVMDIYRSIMYTDGTTVKDHLSSDLYKKCEAYLKGSGDFSEFLICYKAGMWETMLSQAAVAKSPYSTDYAMDTKLINYFNDNNKNVLDVESADFQMKMIGDMSDELCELLIKSFFEQEAGYSDSIKNLYEAWLSGDEKTIAQISSEDEDESGLTDKQIKLIEEYNKTMLDDRNKVMAEKADIYIKEGKNIFFAVGAAHIVSGENSVIKLLEKKGYTIERIKI